MHTVESDNDLLAKLSHESMKALLIAFTDAHPETNMLYMMSLEEIKRLARNLPEAQKELNLLIAQRGD